MGGAGVLGGAGVHSGAGVQVGALRNGRAKEQGGEKRRIVVEGEAGAEAQLERGAAQCKLCCMIGYIDITVFVIWKWRANCSNIFGF